MCASIKNPLERDGTSQQQRLAKALMPENAKIDDRKIEEIIAFALKYSKLINYYNAGNIIEGDWSCFYDSDPCILFALLATTDTDSIEAEFKALQEKIQPGPAATDCEPQPSVQVDQLPGYYDEIINLIYSVAIRIQQACKKLPDGNLLKDEIITMIKNDLHLAIINNAQQDALTKLIGYDKASIEPGNDYSHFIQVEENNSCICTKAWQLDQEGYDCIFPDKSFDFASLKDLFYLFFISLVKIKQRAKIYFEECIAKNDSHQPHVTLFLTFFYLFQNAVDHLNTLTGSHLFYYFDTILCLHKKAETPDRVHIIFELAKNFDTHLVEEGVLLNAGKEDGKQMVYALIEEIVVNKAKVDQIKTVYIDEVFNANGKIINGLVHTAPKADAKDGIAEEFNKDEQPHWRPLGGIDNPATEPGFAIASPMFFMKEGLRAVLLSINVIGVEEIKTPGTFRFYYSSENKWIEVEHLYTYLDNLLSKDEYKLLQEIFSGNQIALTAVIRMGFDLLKQKAAGEQGYTYDEFWETIVGYIKDTSSLLTAIKTIVTPFIPLGIRDGVVTVLDKAFAELMKLKYVYFDSYDPAKKQLDFILLANTTAEPIAPLKPDEKKPDIISEWPVIKILVKTYRDAVSSQYNAMRDLKINGVDIRAGGFRLKDSVVQNDTAILDNSKEIQPFSNRPYKGSYFYIGNKEVFQKKLDFAGVELIWAGSPESFADYYTNYLTEVNDLSFFVSAEFLNNGNFQTLSQGYRMPLFLNSTESSILILGRAVENYSQHVVVTDKRFLGDFRNKLEQIDPRNTEGERIKAELLQAMKAKLPLDGLTREKYKIFLDEMVAALEAINSNTAGENATKDKLLRVIKTEVLSNQDRLSYPPINFFQRDPGLSNFSDYNIAVKRGFLRFNLRQDFLHAEYPLAYTAVVANEGEGLDPNHLPKEPYTPKLKNTFLFYISTERTLFGAKKYNATIEQFYHITPFGYEQIAIDKDPGEVYMLPRFVKASEPLFAQGNLYVGLKDAKPEQKVNILFQVLDGSGENKYSPPDIEWDYLVDNVWVPFKPFEIQDHTRADESSQKSLLKSGIIEFTLPKEISSKKTTILDASLLWIRACAQEDPLPADFNLTQATRRIEALPDLVAIIAQAIMAQFQNNNNTLTHLAAPLPSKTISKFMDSRAAIKTVSQPYNSFDGRLPENDNQFYRRISERLRHKNRAICIWDYERLVLEKFPDLYKVKCLNHTDILENREIAPGFVTISVIPDLRNRNAANKIEPRVPVGILDEIKSFLEGKTNLFVAAPNEPDYLQVVNPLYEPVKVSCCVRFYEGFDSAYYKYVLNKDLKNFLAPWAYDANSEISFGSVYHKSAILNFIEKRKYVDVVLGFKVEHFYDDLTTPLPDYDADRIIPTTSRSILTSYNIVNAGGYEHNIEFIPYDEDNPCPDCDIATTLKVTSKTVKL